MPLRYYIDFEKAGLDRLEAGSELIITDERAHYLHRVMRVRRGERVACFDGHGLTFDCLVSEVGGRRCILRIDAVQARRPAPQVQLHLGIGLLKGQAMDRAVQQAVELGAASIAVLLAERSNVRLTAGAPGRADNKLEHLRRIVQGACEQSGRLFLPALTGPIPLDACLDESSASMPVIAFDPTGAQMPAVLPCLSRLLLIGPEGGWSPQEMALFADRHTHIYRFGGHVLRAETAPGIALALVQQLQGWSAD